MRLTIVAGARPNFIKVAPLIHAINQANQQGAGIQYRLVHTGQHYDAGLSEVFFKELEIPAPHNNLEVGSGSQAVQTANIMIGFEQELLRHRPDYVIVVGDVNSTMACAIVAKKERVKLVHIEAGIRSYDTDMPEEINRIVTDAISDYFFTTTESAQQNLLYSGANPGNIFFVGNIMIDSLTAHINIVKRPSIFDEYNLEDKSYMLMTLHRPSNVDDETQLLNILETVSGNMGNYKLLFPVHPRTRKTLDKLSINLGNIIFTDALSYFDFIYAIENCAAVITDSGGIQEETTFLNIPCITLRNTTERPETIELGTNVLVGNDVALLKDYLSQVVNGTWKTGSIPPLWDGNTAHRIIEVLLDLHKN